MMNFRLLKSFAWLLSMPVFLLSLSGCLSDSNNSQDPSPTAQISFYNASADGPEMDILLNGSKVNRVPFKYSNYFVYVPISAGRHTFKFTPEDDDSTLISITKDFEEKKFYTLFVAESLSSLEAFVTEDFAEVPATGKSALRVIHLSPDTPEVSLFDVGKETPILEGQSYKEVTEFQEVDSKIYNFQLKSPDDDEVLASLPEIELENRRIYTLVIRGFSAPPEGNSNGLKLQLLEN